MLEIEIVDSNIIDGGIEVFARAWQDGVQIGFGIDGSVDIERFRVFNPPVLVEDPFGDIERISIDSLTSEQTVTLFREDYEEAILQVLEGVIKRIAKFDDSNIIVGKVGNTTSTFFPSFDAYVENRGTNFSTVHGASTGFTTGNTATDEAINFFNGTYFIRRTAQIYDTSAIPDGDAISSVTLSLYCTQINNADSDSGSIVQSSIASPTTITTADYDQFGTTKGATDKTFASLTLNAYNVWTFNATGIGWINKTGNTELGVRTAKDVSATPATGNTQLKWRSVDQTGTSQDPVLTVEHAGAPAVSNAARRLFMMTM